MSIVGSSFTKMDIERMKPLKGKVNINNNVAITEVTKEDLALGGSSEKGLKFSFMFTCKYEPDIGHINLFGEILVIEKEEVTKTILASWKDKKQVPKEFMTSILNAVLTKCNVQALIISQTMNLPPPIPMPKISAEERPPQKDVKPETKKAEKPKK